MMKSQSIPFFIICSSGIDWDLIINMGVIMGIMRILGISNPVEDGDLFVSDVYRVVCLHIEYPETGCFILFHV